MTRTTVWLLCLCLPTGLTGCRKRTAPTVSFNDQATAAINEFYNTEPSCLWFEPVALSTNGPADASLLPSLRALAVQGLLTQTRGQTGDRFSLSTAGQTFFRPDTQRAGYGNLCYGSPRVHHITGTSPHHDPGFGDVIDVSYTSELPKTPPWTQVSAVRQAFPKMALEVSQPLPHTATLIQMSQGWEVAAGPASALDTGPAPK